jgi:2-dehydro-3-deoxygluconokinase
MTRVVAVGELLLRLRAPGAERLLQGPLLEATFGGAEFNVLASLARFGLATEFVTALPDGALAAAALGAIRQHGVGSAYVAAAPGRLGLYFLEAGNGLRPARVVYDRAGSVFALCDPRHFDWPAILAGADCLHLTGITPAVSATAAALAGAAADAAVARGVTVSLDVNLRPQVWQTSGREPFAGLAPLLRQARIVFATPSDWMACLPASLPPPPGEADALAAFAAALFAEYPRLEILVAASRRGQDASDFTLGAAAYRRSAAAVAARQIEVRAAAERIGGGDALVAGCLYGLLAGWPDPRWLDFGVAAQALKHTISGDINRVTVQEVESALAGGGGGRVLR